MFKSMLVALTGFDSDESALETALLLGGPFGAHFDCLHIRPGPAEYALTAPGHHFGGVLGPKFVAAVREQDEKQTNAARVAFDVFCRKLDIPRSMDTRESHSGVTAAWHEMFGSDIEVTAREARYHDAAVFGRMPDFAPLSRDAVGQVTMTCGRPVLLASGNPVAPIGDTVAIAWKNCPEAAHAVSAAAPLIEQARNVFVIAGWEAESDRHAVTVSGTAVASCLRWHGATVETRFVDASERSIADAVFEAALSLDAHLMIMGAYGHNRLREMVLGGFTESVLRNAPLPALLVH